VLVCTTRTISNTMDVGDPSNLARILALCYEPGLAWVERVTLIRSPCLVLVGFFARPLPD
jgi:threonine synthase